MCGITGFDRRRRSEIDRSLLHGMTSAITHRGPDGAVLWTLSMFDVFLQNSRQRLQPPKAPEPAVLPGPIRPVGSCDEG